MSKVSRLLRPLAGKQSHTSLTIDGTTVPVTLRRNARARRFILRLDKAGDGVVVTLPPRASQGAALRFAADHAGWISRQRRRQAPPAVFCDGAVIPLRGEMHTVRHCSRSRGTVRREASPPELWVAGRPEHLPRRLHDWLKQQARRDLNAASEHYAAAMRLRFARISIRDQSTRWGSCSTNSNLSYNWRLILAPPFVLDYVAAHEVAHLREMNHSPRFWHLVGQHCPHTDRARAWLKSNGRDLHRYGV